MNPTTTAQSTSTPSTDEVMGRSVAVIASVVVALALRLAVPVWVAPLVAPAVDLSILGLLLGARHLARHGQAASGSSPTPVIANQPSETPPD